jgi:phage repressor protein C with HTH and peptisase S24 domain
MDESNTRLREARVGAGFKSARAAATRFGWKPSTYASHENGQTPVPRKTALVYAKAFKVDPGWLLGVSDAIVNHPKNLAPRQRGSRETSLGPDATLRFDDAIIVPEIDVRAGAGYAGGFNQEENHISASGSVVSRDAVRAQWGIPAPFLRDELHIQPGRVHILSVRGDSMNDALFDGDRAIINLDDTDVSQGGIFALLDDNESVIIKQVEFVRSKGGGPRMIRCTSRNSAYAPFDLALEHPVKIIGRVASKITRL